MKIDDFDYNLPEDRIALYPAAERGRSKLMILERATETIEHELFEDIGKYLDQTDLLVLNNTRVIPARLTDFEIEGHGRTDGAEVFLLRELQKNRWECLVKPGRKLKVGTRLLFAKADVGAELISNTDFGGRVIEFHTEGDITDMLERIGQVPLPPYIKRPPEKEYDRVRYQTVYAEENGSVAAPTAGLHFSPELLTQLRHSGISTHFITLHVGLGTFRPIHSEDLEQHRMHSEYFHIGRAVAEALTSAKKSGRKVTAVGTTTVRALETAADSEGALRETSGDTSLFIRPGYRFKCVDKMITNFHLPRSTLLAMVCAFAGREKIMAAYDQAIKMNYRFYSYGDAMLIK